VSATQTIIAGLVPLSLALILVAKLVVDEAIGNREGTIVATVVAVVLIALWWVLPLRRKRERA
jgi:ABC-type Na+ efflux pump permease subunit